MLSCQESHQRLATCTCTSGNSCVMVAAYSGMFVWSPVPSPSHQHPQAQPHWVTRERKKICPLSSFNNALSALVDTKTHWHVQNSHTMLSRQHNVSLLYALTTTFAYRDSSRVKPHTPGKDCHTLVKKVYKLLPLNNQLPTSIQGFCRRG